MSLNPLITKAGLAAVARAEAEGKKLSYAKIQLGTESYVPTGDEAKLKGLKEEVTIADSARVGANRIHLTADFGFAAAAYAVGEIALVAQLESEEIFFAVLSAPGQVQAQRLIDEALLFGMDIVEENIPPGVMNVTGVGERLNLSVATNILALTLSQVQSQTTAVDTLQRLGDLQLAFAALKADVITRLQLAEEALAELKSYTSRYAFYPTKQPDGSLLFEFTLTQLTAKSLRIHFEQTGSIEIYLSHAPSDPLPRAIKLSIRKKGTDPIDGGLNVTFPCVILNADRQLVVPLELLSIVIPSEPVGTTTTYVFEASFSDPRVSGGYNLSLKSDYNPTGKEKAFICVTQ